MDINSSAPNSFCFASPLGLAPASEGGSYSQGLAGTETCDGKNGGMGDSLLVGTNTPLYFSVIQYSKDPFSSMEANFAFRLAFLPTGKEGPQQVLGYSDKPYSEGLYESQPWYGVGFRFGGSQADLDVKGVASCGGYPANPDQPDIRDGQWVTAACPFAPDEIGDVAGQTFLSSLELTAEKNLITLHLSRRNRLVWITMAMTMSMSATITIVPLSPTGAGVKVAKAAKVVKVAATAEPAKPLHPCRSSEPERPLLGPGGCGAAMAWWSPPPWPPAAEFSQFFPCAAPFAGLIS